jgi:hypothetical protein
MSRRHAPCGNVSGADASFPFSGGLIGSWGWNAVTNALVAPNASDLMGYCSNQWISSHNFTAMLNYRSSSTNASVQPAMSAAGATTDRLLVWGTLRAGSVQVEPAFLLTNNGRSGERNNPGIDEPVLDATRAVRIEVLDVNGQVLASRLANASEIDHSTDGTRSFAATIPLTAQQQAQLHGVRVGDVRTATARGTRQRSAAAAIAAAQGQAAPAALVASRDGASRDGASRVRLNWNTSAYPRAMIRNAETGRILGFVTNTTNTFAWRGGAVDVVLSDGVRSRVERITPQ